MYSKQILNYLTVSESFFVLFPALLWLCTQQTLNFPVFHPNFPPQVPMTSNCFSACILHELKLQSLPSNYWFTEKLLFPPMQWSLGKIFLNIVWLFYITFGPVCVTFGYEQSILLITINQSSCKHPLNCFHQIYTLLSWDNLI